MSINWRDDQADKKTTVPQAKASPPANKTKALEKVPEKAKKNKNNKKKICQGRRDNREGNSTTAISENNAVQAINGQKKKKTWDISEVTYYSYNKKSYFAKDCTESKN